MAIRFSELGYTVAGTDVIDSSSLPSELSEYLQQYWAIDFGNCDLVEKGFNKIFKEYLPDILVNNAGQKIFKELSEFSAAQIRTAVNVNLIAPMIITKLWSEIWHGLQHDKIVNILISSNAAYRGYAKGSVYCGSKSGLRIFGEAMIEENKDTDMQTLVVCPETFSSSKSGIQPVLSANEVFDKIYHAILWGRSCEVPILSIKSRLRYLSQNCTRNLRWVIYGQ